MIGAFKEILTLDNLKRPRFSLPKYLVRLFGPRSHQLIISPYIGSPLVSYCSFALHYLVFPFSSSFALSVEGWFWGPFPLGDQIL